MISVYKLKPKFQALLQPLLARLHKWGVSPNLLTLLGILLSVAMGIYAFYGNRILALILLPLVLSVRMALTALAGMMARQFNMQSKLGAVLNEIGDIVSDIALYYPLYILFKMDPTWIMFFLLFSALNEFAGLLGQAINEFALFFQCTYSIVPHLDLDAYFYTVTLEYPQKTTTCHQLTT